MNEQALKKGNETRQAILNCIIEYINKHGYSPSYEEIGHIVGIKSKSTIHDHIHKMLECGMLETDTEGYTSRALRVPGYKYVKIDTE